MKGDEERETLPTVAAASPAVMRGRSKARPPADDEERRAFRRAMMIGLFVWPAFHLVDQYLGRIVYPGAPLGLFFLLRVIGEVAIFGMYSLSFRTTISSFELKLANVGVCGLCSVFISVMAVSFGGLTSPYLHGIAIVILVLALAVPGPWRDTILYAAACSLSFPIVILASTRTHPELAHKLVDPKELALFTAHYVILTGSAIVATVSSQASWNARQELRRARQLGRYRLEMRIGKGGMNEVWLAWDQSLQRNVALKILRSAGADNDARTLARFEREALALSRLRSPYTVRVFDYAASDDGFSFIAMEYLAGKDIAALVSTEGCFSAERTVRLGLQAARSLGEAHEAGIVHRDVKPANLFVTTSSDGREILKVLDFGIARLLEEENATRTQSVHGTPAYMAPECWSGSSADARSDIYALGGTLWFMLVGRAPFEGSSDLVRAHLVERPARPSTLVSGIPESLDDLVLRCLEKDPRARFSDTSELVDALSDCLEELSSYAVPSA